jgi:hypothetical protein
MLVNGAALVVATREITKRAMHVQTPPLNETGGHPHSSSAVAPWRNKVEQLHTGPTRRRVGECNMISEGKNVTCRTRTSPRATLMDLARKEASVSKQEKQH